MTPQEFVTWLKGVNAAVETAEGKATDDLWKRIVEELNKVASPIPAPAPIPKHTPRPFDVDDSMKKYDEIIKDYEKQRPPIGWPQPTAPTPYWVPGIGTGQPLPMSPIITCGPSGVSVRNIGTEFSPTNG